MSNELKDVEITELKEVEGSAKRQSVVHRKANKKEHDLKILINDMVRNAKKDGIPLFAMYYSPIEGMVYNGVIPEEIENPSPEVIEIYGKFNDIMRICIGFNKEEFLGSEIIKLS